MGFIKAIAGAVGGTLADQWTDYLGPTPEVTETAGLFPAVPMGTNAGRGANTKGSSNVISNGSKIVVPEGCALITVNDGAITGCVAEPGGFIFQSDDINAQSIFAGNGVIAPLIKQSWERFKAGGIPSSGNTAFYVNLKPIPDNRFGTEEKIRFFDSYLNAQVALYARGSYELRIVDPIVFVKLFVPVNYLTNGLIFDFSDMSDENKAVDQICNDVKDCLQPALSRYASDPEKRNSIIKLQGDTSEFVKILATEVERVHKWRGKRGLQITDVSMTGLDYDEKTQELVDRVAEADAFTGSRGNTFMQMSAARGFENAGQNGGGQGMAFMGMGMNTVGNTMGAFQQPVQQPAQQPAQQPVQQQPVQEDPYEVLAKYKRMLDEGLITQEEYDAQKKKILGV